MFTIRRLAAVLALLLVVTACGGDQPASELPIDGDAAVSGPAAGACPEGTPDCVDTLLPGEEPGALPEPGGGTDLPGPVPFSVDEAIAAGGAVSVSGYYVDRGDGARLCEVLAESFPPQCGGASIPLADLSQVDPESIRTEGGTSWSDDPVLIVGEIVDGVLVPAGLGE